MLRAPHSGRAARLQESRAEAGVVAAPRTEAQRMAVQKDCAERPRGQLCGTAVQAEAQRMAVQTEGPRGRHWLAACRLALSDWNFSD